MRTAVLARIVLLACALAPLAAHAADDPAANGRIKAYTCAGCHGVTGYRNAYPSYRVPKIVGQNYEYLVASLTAYRTGERTHPTMQAQGESLSDQDIADIARFLAGPQAATP